LVGARRRAGGAGTATIHRKRAGGIQHINSVYYAMSDQLVVKYEGLRLDIAHFFSIVEVVENRRLCRSRAANEKAFILTLRFFKI
jgi:hypothetical protein